MANRVLLGKDGSNVYALKVSKPGDNVLNPQEPLLFDSSAQSGSGRYFITKSAIDMGSYINQSFGDESSKSLENMGYTYNSNLYRYLPLMIVVEDCMGTFFNSGNLYYNPNSAAYKSYLGVNSGATVTESHAERATMYRVSHKYSPVRSTQSGGSLDNIYRGDIGGEGFEPIDHEPYYTVRSYCWAGSAGDFGTNFALWDTSSSDNNQWNSYGNYVALDDTGGAGSATSDKQGYIPRQKFRVSSSGAALNSTWFRKTDGGIHEVSTGNSGGAKIENAKVALFGIPCGYGFMNSNFMGF